MSGNYGELDAAVEKLLTRIYRMGGLEGVPGLTKPFIRLESLYNGHMTEASGPPGDEHDAEYSTHLQEAFHALDDAVGVVEDRMRLDLREVIKDELSSIGCGGPDMRRKLYENKYGDSEMRGRIIRDESVSMWEQERLFSYDSVHMRCFIGLLYAGAIRHGSREMYPEEFDNVLAEGLENHELPESPEDV